MIQVLLVEDDEKMANVIKYYLAKEQFYDITHVVSYQDAIMQSAERYDIILLDIMLPDGDGIQLCQELRQRHNCPIIFLSALQDNDTIISALANGGDDYIPKPFDNRILNARIKACLRRVVLDKAPKSNNNIVYKNYSLDLAKHIFDNGTRKIHLMQLEYQILALLMQNIGRCLHSEAIYKAIWGNDSFGDTRTVVVHIYNLRKEIEDDYRNPKIIRNIWGKGYCFDPDGMISE